MEAHHPAGTTYLAASSHKHRPIKNLLQILVNLVSRKQTGSIEEKYLAQAVDPQGLEVGLLRLERARP
jgi:hypothetical protein